MSHGCFEPDRRGRFAAGFLLRHEDIKSALTQWLLARVKRDINISDVRLGGYLAVGALAYIHAQTPSRSHACMHACDSIILACIAHAPHASTPIIRRHVII